LFAAISLKAEYLGSVDGQAAVYKGGKRILYISHVHMGSVQNMPVVNVYTPMYLRKLLFVLPAAPMYIPKLITELSIHNAHRNLVSRTRIFTNWGYIPSV